MEVEKINYFKKRLTQEKQTLITQMAGLAKTLSEPSGAAIGELSVCDNHPADLGDELFERSKDLALHDNAHIILEKVELAIKKIVDGQYGYCDICSLPIPMARLEAIPWANECISCQKHEDASNVRQRPIEESLLTPPFKRTFLDHDPEHSVGFDGEDALQAVMGYGSSDTPQDLPGTHDYKDLFPNSHEQGGIVDPMDRVRRRDHSPPNKGT